MKRTPALRNGSQNQLPRKTITRSSANWLSQKFSRRTTSATRDALSPSERLLLTLGIKTWVSKAYKNYRRRYWRSDGAVWWLCG
jgi:hypothetical protein